MGEFEFALKAALRHWFGFIGGEPSYQYENFETVGPDESCFGAYVSVGKIGGPMPYVDFTGFLVDGSFQVDLSGCQLNGDPRINEETAKANLAGDKVYRIDVHAVRKGRQVTLWSEPVELPEDEVRDEIGDRETVFAWAKNYKPEPTNVIQLPASLGGGEAYRVRELDAPASVAPAPAEVPTFDRALALVMKEFLGQGPEYVFSAYRKMNVRGGFTTSEHAYCLDVYLRRIHGQPMLEWLQLPRNRPADPLAGAKAAMLKSYGEDDFASIMLGNPLLWASLCYDGEMSLTEQVHNEILRLQPDDNVSEDYVGVYVVKQLGESDPSEVI